MSAPTKDFSLVIPCYNEADSLSRVIARAVAAAKQRGLGPERFELVIVDNGSTDGTAPVLAAEERGADAAYLRVVRVVRNRGYGHGILTGLRAARGRLVGWTHADQQCDPEDALRAWDVARRGEADLLVKGRRVRRELGPRLFSLAFHLTALAFSGRRLPEINAQPKVFRRELVAALDGAPDGFAFDLFVLLRARERGLRFAAIPVVFGRRAHGESKWAASWRSRARTIRGVLAFLWRYRPLPV